ncbi:SPOR domain-containing protein [Paracoccus sp. (in: a-proteobacteria)]|uniref:SPOR domain-containing protein n=1 Tax=Paracoccus sp. TaxID=267 RepID=UPI0035B1EC1C
MTVVDFRSSGGFEGSQPQRLAQDYPNGQGASPGQEEYWQDGGWDDHHHHAYAEAVAEAPSLLGRLTRLTHYVGALVSVALIVILAVWGFKLVVRDVSGVPVIRAIEGAARTAPDNPGGELTARTGLAVNSVAAGSEAAPVDRVAIAPQPTALNGQDVAMGELGASAQEPSHPVELPLMDDAARVIARPDGEVAAPLAADAVANATISDAPAAEAAVNEVVTDLAGNEARDVAITTALAEAVVAVPPGLVAKSDRPAPRPRRVAAAAAAAPAPAAAAARPAAAESRPAAAPEAARETAPAEAPAETRVASGASLVQIGAFDSDKLAKGEWNRVSGKFGALFAGKGMVIQKHETNGRAFWRLRAAGFASTVAARRFCAALIADGIDCIPATAK